MIYIINNHGQFTHLIHRSLRDLDVGNKLVGNDLDVEEVSEEADGVILSGGPSINRIGNCREYVNELNVPILGICLGHQVIADELGGEINEGDSGGYAAIELDIIENDRLFKGLGNSLEIWASHADEVTELPPNFELLAKSDVCGIEAMYNSKRNIFGIQGHPEVSHTPHGDKIIMNFINQCNLD